MKVKSETLKVKSERQYSVSRGLRGPLLAWTQALVPFVTLVLTLILASPHAHAQQESQYSQYMFNGLFLNPAYAGSRDHASMSLIGRNQWTGFDGAPKSAAFTLHGPSASMKSGFGMM